MSFWGKIARFFRGGGKPASRASRRAPGFAPATWLQWPAIAPGGAVDVAGAHHNTSALWAVADSLCTGMFVKYVTAELVREPANPYDEDAVMVVVGGSKVGYLPREEAPRYHDLVDSLRSHGQLATCRARLSGAWTDCSRPGIVLDVDQALKPNDRSGPFFPPDRRVDLQGEEHCQDFLQGVLRGEDQSEARGLLSVVEGVVEASIDGSRVGGLSKAMSLRYAPIVAGAADMPASCDCEVRRGRKKVEVRVRVPTVYDPSDGRHAH